MEITLHILAGFLMAFIGLLPPGMLNMTTARTSLISSFKTAIKFAAGACIIVGIHAIIAFLFADYLNSNPQIIHRLRVLGMVVMFGLSYFFWSKTKSKFKVKGKENLANPFLSGLGMSALNMLGIPFYLGMSTLLAAKESIVLEPPYIYFLAIGAMIGSFSLFITYGYFADFIDRKIGFIARNINYILAALFAILGISIGVNLVF
jgi:threonine/homoserine/homoserine lactone efflux protein